jgi:ATP-dependent Clp protease ATP-binding subunit ClpA
MFDRFTDRARKVMGFARQEAEKRGHAGIRSGHILLGLAKESNGVGSIVLNEFSSLEEMGLEADKHWGELPKLSLGDKVAPGGLMVMDFATKEAEALGHGYVGTEHVLLGICRSCTGSAYDTLIGLDLSIEEIRNRIMKLLGVEREEDDDDVDEEPSPVLVLAASIADSLRRIARTEEIKALRQISGEGEAKETYDALLQEIVDGE